MNGKERLILIGIDFNSAAEAVRAACHLSPGQIERIYQNHSGPAELLILSTCNRTEFYFYGLDKRQAWRRLEKIFEGLWPERKNFYIYQDQAVCLHLMELATGLKSMLIGETEILGQVRAAWQRYLQSIPGNGQLGELFRKGLSYARRIRQQTDIGGYSASLTTLVIKTLKKAGARLRDESVLILGNGPLGQKLARIFLAHDLPTVILTRGLGVKRRPRPQQLIDGVRIVFGYDHLERLLLSHSIVVAATGAPHYVLKREHARLLEGKFLLDLAFPRNIDPVLADIARGKIWDLDYFGKMSEANRQNKVVAIAEARCRCIVAAEQIRRALYEPENKDWNPREQAGIVSGR